MKSDLHFLFSCWGCCFGHDKKQALLSLAQLNPGLFIFCMSLLSPENTTYGLLSTYFVDIMMNVAAMQGSSRFTSSYMLDVPHTSDRSHVM